MVTFGVYVIIAVYWKNESLLSAQAFTAIALISLLTMPVLIFIQALPAVVESVACFDRIQEFCNYDPKSTNLDSTASEGQNAASGSDEGIELRKMESKPLLSIQGQSFSWDKASPVVLEDVKIQIARSKVTAIVGPVGSGKSAFLNCILGEMVNASSSATGVQNQYPVTEPVAYCCQQPWLENKTIRQNIIGISLYDRKWYCTVKVACGLEEDLDQMKRGDLTMIGSKGLTLSGGQKQRIVSLAITLVAISSMLTVP